MSDMLRSTQWMKNHSTLHWYQCGRLVVYQFCVWWLYFAFMPLLTYERYTLLALQTCQRSLSKYSLNDQTSSLPPPLFLLLSLPVNLWRSMTAVPQRKHSRQHGKRADDLVTCLLQTIYFSSPQSTGQGGRIVSVFKLQLYPSISSSFVADFH